jgi:hypothetical protein
MEIADTGQTPTHPPQPVHRSESSSGRAPPDAGRKVMAPSPQASRQLKQVTPFFAKQLGAIRAVSVQGG